MSWQFTQEMALANQAKMNIEQFWQAHVKTGQFAGAENIPISYAYCLPPGARQAVLLSNGRVETYLKYKEVIYDLFQNDIACFTLDHRGQGLSGRMTVDPQQGFVRDFNHYVYDLLTYTNQIIAPLWSNKMSLLCHSMGGAIGALTLIREPDLFESAVFCSPMFGIKPALPDWAAKTLINAGLKTNQMRKLDSGYFFGQKPYTAYPFKVNPLTHSKARYESMLALYKKQPELKIGGVTSEWLAAAHKAMNDIEKEAAKIRQPVLVLSSGRDLIIDNKRQKRVSLTIPKVKYHSVKHAFHELLMEKDKYRNDALTQVLDFLTE